MARYFGQNLDGEGDEPSPSVEALRGLQPMERSRAEAAMRAQDKVASQSRRVLWQTGLNGDDAWLVPNTMPGATQTHPEEDVSRANSIGKFDLTQGCCLIAECLHVPSGKTSAEPVPPNWVPGGVQGIVEFATVWTAHDASTLTHTFQLSLDGSTLAHGSEDTSNGGLQNSLRLRHLVMVPPTDLTTQGAKNKWSRPHSVAITVSYVGSPRVIDLTISEIPLHYVMEADDPDNEWVGHVVSTGTPDSKMPSPAYPVDEREDTTSSDKDQRIGTLQCLRVNANQRRRLGLQLFHWTSYQESAVAVTDTALIPVTIGTAASARWCNLLNTDQFATQGSPAAFEPSEPGWSVSSGGYARKWRDNNPQVFPTTNLAAVPVLFRVYAQNNDTASVELRLHTAPDDATATSLNSLAAYSWISLTLAGSGSLGWFDAWGYVTVGLNPEQHVVAQVMVKQETSGTDLDVYAVQAYVWDGSYAPI